MTGSGGPGSTPSSTPGFGPSSEPGLESSAGPSAPPSAGGAAVARAVPRRPASGRAQGGLLYTLPALLRVLVVGIFLTTFLLQPFRIPSASMVPTLQIGDFVLVSKTGAAPEPDGLWGALERRLLPRTELRRGDLVVFYFPPDPTHDLVKRVVALPGERLQMRGGRVFINGQALRESYAMYTPEPPEVFRDEFPNLREADPNVNPRWWLTLRHSLGGDGELTVPPNSYFVLGDNRNHSEDSRYWGFVPQAKIIGRPLLIYFAVPDGADAPEGGPAARLAWLGRWVRERVGVPH